MVEIHGEALPERSGINFERISFVQAGAARTLVLMRLPRDRSLEVRLLPFLAQKSPRVPVVFSRGIPPPITPAPPWVLVEDCEGHPSACDSDPRAIIEAKAEIERAVANDGPALRALGVPVISPDLIARRVADAAPDRAAEALLAGQRLADEPQSLVHGNLTCRQAVVGDRGVVIRDWGQAHLGCALLDVVRLTSDLVGRGEAVLGIGLSRVYGALVDRAFSSETLRAAELLEKLSRRYLTD